MKSKGLLLGCVCCWAMLGVAPSYADEQRPPFHHIVIVYEENHSFDNLYGLWGSVGGSAVNGLPQAPQSKTVQVRQDNKTAYGCLLQNDVNLTSPPLPTTCTDSNGSPVINSDFGNGPFGIDNFIAPTDTTCPPPGTFYPNGVPKGQGLPGGCTEDLMHRYYSEQYQINNGSQNRYVTGSDAAGLSMGYYDSTQLPIYTFLHSTGAPNYVIADNFFQGAFGGSFLNHQWLIAAATPIFANAINDGSSQDLHSVVDQNGMPRSTPLYTSPLGSQAIDAQLSASCNPPAGRPQTPKGVTCGDYAVNTIQPFNQPFSPGTADYKRLPVLDGFTIGDAMSAAGISWAWYAGGWSNAAGIVGGPGWTNGDGTQGCIDPNANPKDTWPYCGDYLFQYHHQPFDYYAAYSPGTQARATHLLDEVQFINDAQSGNLPAVSFIKPIGEQNEHPGYTGEDEGSDHLVDLLTAILTGPQGSDTLVIVTYDEFGGQWDHVPSPGTPGGAGGPHDKWGPGTRIPALILSSSFRYSGVDHSLHDTTSILATIEHMFNTAPLGPRDAANKDLFGAANFGVNGH